MIIRNDRGLDFKRIEKLIENFQKKTTSIIQGYRKEKEKAIKEREKTAYQHFGLNKVLLSIEDINNKIKDLEKSKKEYESKIRDYTQGTDPDRRYSSYDTVREGSPIHTYVNDVDMDFKHKEAELRKLDASIEEQLWLAPDIDIATEIIKKHIEQRDKITEVQ